jgi:hypothetical protein
MSSQHAVIGVLGASGGLGASTISAGLAGQLAGPATPAVCVDGDFHGGGLDVTACLEHQGGLRWPDLAGVRGEVDGAELLRALPAQSGTHVLSAGPAASPPPEAAVLSVVRSLRSGSAVTVLDLPRTSPYAGLLAAQCDVVLLLCGLSARHLADAEQAVAAVMPSCPEVWLVVRGRGRRIELAEAVAAHLDLPLAGCWREDARVRVDAERGRPPADRPSPALRVLAKRALAAAGQAARPKSPDASSLGAAS